MRLRLPPRDASDVRATESSGDASSEHAGRESRTGVVRKLVLLALGLAAVAYAVRRYVGLPDAVPSMEDVADVGDRVPSTDELREQTTEAVPGEFQEIPIGERGAGDGDESDGDESVADVATETAASAVDDADAAEDVTEVVDDDETSVDMTDEERSSEEISERADETVPEPGEMAVDEDVADELVDEDESESDDGSDRDAESD